MKITRAERLGAIIPPYRARMPVTASISSERVQVPAGGTASVELTLRNVGTVVDEVRLDVLGDAAAWTSVSPATVPLFPGAAATVVLMFAPPRSTDTPEGEVDVAVKATSREDPEGSAVEELVVSVAGFDQPVAELVPRTTRGGRKRKVQVAIDNLGNRRLQRDVDAVDPDLALRFEAEPPSVVVSPGRAGFATLTVRPNKTFLRGPERTYPYRVSLADGDNVIGLDGTFVQTALLPRWLLRLLALLLAGLLLLLVLWQTMLKPVIRTAARTAAAADVEEAADKAAEQAASQAAAQTAKALGASPEAIAAANKAAAGGGSAPDGGGGGGGGGASAAGSGGGDDGKGGLSVDKRLFLEVDPGQTKIVDWEPGGKDDRFSLTDVVLQNPQGDTGVLRIKRGDDILLESALENFRDLDFHLVAPLVVKGQPLRLEVACANGEGTRPCRDAATLAGFLVKAKP